MKEPRMGKDLEDDFKSLRVVRVPIFEEFLYEKDVLFVFGKAGEGKSVIGQQMAMAASTGLSLFGGLHCPGPKKTYYMQLEGDYDESVERMRLMSGRIQPTFDNLCWDECKGLNVMQSGMIDWMVKRIADRMMPNLIIVDPIYKSVWKDLTDGEAVQSVVRLSDALLERFKCAVVLIHHVHRERYDRGKAVKEDTPYFGHSYLENHVRTAYHFQKKAANERLLERKKGRGSDTLSSIHLFYDPVTMTLNMDDGRMESWDRVINFVAHLRLIKQQTTDFYEIRDGAHLSDSQLRRFMEKDEFYRLINIDKTKKKHVWRVRTE